MLKKLSVKSQLRLVLAGMVGILVTFAIVVWIAADSIATAANDMRRGSDMVSDVKAPPLTVLEAELTVLQLENAKPEDMPGLIAKLQALKSDYDDRLAFWAGEPLDNDVRNALTGEQKTAADEFWRIALGDFLAAVQDGDGARVRALSDELQRLYLAHRVGAEGTLNVAAMYADSKLRSLNETSTHVRWMVLALAAGSW